MNDRAAPADRPEAPAIQPDAADGDPGIFDEPEVILPPSAPPALALAASGTIRFAITRESLGLRIGRAEYNWEFTDDGHYFLRAVTETSGIAAVFAPRRLALESRGRLVASGLQPERFRSRRDGGEVEEGADFDWENGEILILRDGRKHRLTLGAQDILSLVFQLSYLGSLDDGAGLSVATARKFEWQRLESLGEESIELPAGHFRTRHLRAQSNTSTEVWIALDHGNMPVKIRFTDKKGDAYEQVATELGL
ncbi:MAG: DUF3108 domain-containing protein [Azonexus sp.]|nr:DUF3108 domain-containing protein [Azonexus sp.]